MGLPDRVVQTVECVGSATHGGCNTARITVDHQSMTPVTADIPVVHTVYLGGTAAKTMQLSEVFLATHAVNLTQAIVDRTQSIPESNETNNMLATTPPIGGHSAKLSVADVSAKEGKPLRFVVSLSPTAGLPVSVDYAVSRSAAQSGAACGKGSEFVAANGRLQFAKGGSSKSVEVQTCSDDVAEGLEGLRFTLSRLPNAEPARATATGPITD